MRRIALGLVLSASCLSGCTMLEWLAPHQLWKLNRQPAISRDDAYFSIPAQPIPKNTAESEVAVEPF